MHRAVAMLAALCCGGWTINPGLVAHVAWTPAAGNVAGYEVMVDDRIIHADGLAAEIPCVAGREYVVTVRAISADGSRGPESDPSVPFRCFDVRGDWMPDADDDGVVSFSDFKHFGRAFGGDVIAP